MSNRKDKPNNKDWKKLLKIEVESESWDFRQRETLGLSATWKNFPIIRKGMALTNYLTKGTHLIEHIEYEDPEADELVEIGRYKERVPKFWRYLTPKELLERRHKAKKELYGWFSRMILNYDDLTPAQRKRVDKQEPIEELGAGLTDYAILKTIKVREPFSKYKYKIVKKTVIVELK